MRLILLLPLAIVAVAGCGTEEAKHTASPPARDLALPAQQAPQVEVASALELGRPEAPQAPRQTRRSARRSQPVTAQAVPAAISTAPATAVTVVPAIYVPTPAASVPASDRELPPGKTVTIIPASTGPSPSRGDAGEHPGDRGHTMVIRGGDTCRKRGRGPIGIASAPAHPDFR
jgi:hypothetical protein